MINESCFETMAALFNNMINNVRFSNHFRRSYQTDIQEVTKVSVASNSTEYHYHVSFWNNDTTKRYLVNNLCNFDFVLCDFNFNMALRFASVPKVS